MCTVKVALNELTLDMIAWKQTYDVSRVHCESDSGTSTTFERGSVV